MNIPPMSLDSANLAYTILLSLIGLAFFTGRLSIRVDRLDRDYQTINQTSREIFRELNKLSQIVTATETILREHTRKPEE